MPPLRAARLRMCGVPRALLSSPARRAADFARRAPAISGVPPATRRREFASLASSPAPDFRDTAFAYQSLSDTDLLRAVGVFTACGCGPLVRNAEFLLAAAVPVEKDLAGASARACSV